MMWSLLSCLALGSHCFVGFTLVPGSAWNPMQLRLRLQGSEAEPQLHRILGRA